MNEWMNEWIEWMNEWNKRSNQLGKQCIQWKVNKNIKLLPQNLLITPKQEKHFWLSPFQNGKLRCFVNSM